MKKVERKGSFFYELKILYFGMEVKVKVYDMIVVVYFRNISMRCFYFFGKCVGLFVKDNVVFKINIGIGFIFCIFLCVVFIFYIYSVLVML